MDLRKSDGRIRKTNVEKDKGEGDIREIAKKKDRKGENI